MALSLRPVGGGTWLAAITIFLLVGARGCQPSPFSCWWGHVAIQPLPFSLFIHDLHSVEGPHARPAPTFLGGRPSSSPAPAPSPPRPAPPAGRHLASPALAPPLAPQPAGGGGLAASDLPAWCHISQHAAAPTHARVITPRAKFCFHFICFL